jgi:hypothetical protein
MITSGRGQSPARPQQRDHEPLLEHSQRSGKAKGHCQRRVTGTWDDADTLPSKTCWPWSRTAPPPCTAAKRATPIWMSASPATPTGLSVTSLSTSPRYTGSGRRRSWPASARSPRPSHRPMTRSQPTTGRFDRSHPT